MSGRHVDGFTLIEILLVISLLSIIFATSFVGVSRLRSVVLAQQHDEVVQLLTEANRHARYGYQDRPWGVWFEVDADGRLTGMTLFAGSTYETRDLTYDRVVTFLQYPAVSVSLTDGVSPVTEARFDAMTGITSTTGTISLTTGAYEHTITLEPSGISWSSL